MKFNRIFTTPDFYDESKHEEITSDIPEYDVFLKDKEKVNEIGYSVCDMTSLFKPCYINPLLTRKQEYHLFRKYNLFKFIAQKNFESNNKKYNHFLLKSQKLRNLISECNFRLAVKEVKRDKGVDEDELSVAYGCIHVCVDYFDFRKGNRFSTYSTWAIRREVGKYIGTEKKHYICENMGQESFNIKSNDNGCEEKIDAISMGEVLSSMLSDLSERERTIVRNRYGFNKEKISFKEINSMYGISKSRVDQIRAAGIEKMIKNKHLLKGF